MKFLDSPAAFLAAVMVGIFAFGLGLTSPIWFLLDGMGPVDALHAGTPVVTCTIAGLIVTTIAGVAAYRMRKPSDPEETAPADIIEDSPWKHRLVHALVILMFVLPFLTIVLGLLLTQIIDSDAG